MIMAKPTRLVTKSSLGDKGEVNPGPVAFPTFPLPSTRLAVTEWMAVLELSGGARGKARGLTLKAAPPALVLWPQ